jgi:choline kinase
MAQWQKVFSAEQSYRAEIVKDFLEDSSIQAVIVNKKDSSYNNFGSHEVHVATDDVMRALQIIKNDIDFK